MIKLENIKRNNNIIECDIIPEDSMTAGHIVVDLVLEDIREYNLPKGYEWCKNHVSHARNSLIEFVKQDNIPTEKIVAWN